MTTKTKSLGIVEATMQSIKLDIPGALTADIQNSYTPFAVEAQELVKAASLVDLTNIPDEDLGAHLKNAKKITSKLVKVRTGLDKTRKQLKDPYKNAGTVIDMVAKEITKYVTQAEDHLKTQQAEVEAREAKKVEQLRTDRLAELEKVAPKGLAAVTMLDLGTLTSEQFAEVTTIAIQAHHDAVDAQMIKEKELELKRKEEELQQREEALRKQAAEKAEPVVETEPPAVVNSTPEPVATEPEEELIVDTSGRAIPNTSEPTQLPAPENDTKIIAHLINAAVPSLKHVLEAAQKQLMIPGNQTMIANVIESVDKIIPYIKSKYVSK